MMVRTHMWVEGVWESIAGRPGLHNHPGAKEG